MTRPLLLALVIVLALNFIAGLAFVGWLAATDRLSRARVKQAVEIFQPTFAQQRELDAEREAQQQLEQQRLEQLARLESVAEGPRTLEVRLAENRQADELAHHRLERLVRETADLRQQIERAKTLIAQQRAQLEQERKAFETFVTERDAKLADEEFQRAVRMYEQLRPAQAKEMFQELIGQGQIEQVVDYLAEMQLRRAGRVLEQFREPDEIVQATELIERLRRRGVYAEAALASMPGGREDQP